LIIEKITANDFRDAEYILAMRDGKENIVMQMAAKLNYLLAMAGWAKPAPSTTENKKILMVAIGAAYSGEALMKVTTFQVLANYMGNYGRKKPYSREKKSS
jgi:hypothetical protein